MDRLSRSDEDAFKNQHKARGPDNHHARGGVRQSGDEKGLQDRQLLRRRSNDDEEDGDDEEERMTRDDGQRYANARAGLCAVCHLTVGGIIGPGSNTHTSGRQLKITFLDVSDCFKYSDTKISKKNVFTKTKLSL